MRVAGLLALLPRAGLYAGRERALPYDYDELLAAVAPRPLRPRPRKGRASRCRHPYLIRLSAAFWLMVFAPLRDRFATPADVAKAAAAARAAYAAAGEWVGVRSPR
eukprot:gene6943-1665_t